MIFLHEFLYDKFINENRGNIGNNFEIWKLYTKNLLIVWDIWDFLMRMKPTDLNRADKYVVIDHEAKGI